MQRTLLLLIFLVLMALPGCNRWFPNEAIYPKRATGKITFEGWRLDTVFRAEPYKSWESDFVSEQVGYLVSENYGDVHKTIDGGKIWRKLSDGLLPSGQGIYNDVDFLDERTGFIAVFDQWGCAVNCRNRATLFVTRNGGETWELVQADQQKTLWQIHFTSPTEGIAFASTLIKTNSSDSLPELLFTKDGGKSWQKIEGVLPGRGIRQMEFLNRQVGFLQGDNRTFYRTLDGGKTWETFPDALTTWQYQFVTPDKGFATTSEGFYKTENGGKTWQKLFEGWSYLVGFPSEQEGFFVRTIREYANDIPDFDSEILRTTDGGTTWSRSQPVHNFDVFRPYEFPGSRAGYTTDGSFVLKLSKP